MTPRKRKRKPLLQVVSCADGVIRWKGDKGIPGFMDRMWFADAINRALAGDPPPKSRKRKKSP